MLHSSGRRGMFGARTCRCMSRVIRCARGTRMYIRDSNPIASFGLSLSYGDNPFNSIFFIIAKERCVNYGNEDRESIRNK